ncbi:MAG: hypothetical protein SFW09_02440 [Hyphomicrobiaceae bacterium]|nr:hypothetical protein [Hyphomicrobiaceae bacterium]
MRKAYASAWSEWPAAPADLDVVTRLASRCIDRRTTIWTAGLLAMVLAVAVAHVRYVPVPEPDATFDARV